MKKEKGFVSLGGAYADPEDEVLARISKLSRTTLTRLHAEIARSISFYRANQGGTQPLRIFLAGGAVSMPYMLEFFSEKLQIPVEFLNPFRNVVVASTVDADLLSSKAHAAGEVVGLALRELGNCPVEINLRPPAVVAAQTLAKRKPYLIAATACLFLLLAQWWAYFAKTAAVQSDVLQSVNGEVAKLEGKANEFDKLKRQQDEVEAVAAPLLTAAREREVWVHILDELSAKLPRVSSGSPSSPRSRAAAPLRSAVPVNPPPQSPRLPPAPVAPAATRRHPPSTPSRSRASGSRTTTRPR
jgi:type IV pilus assembly protein PilM